MTNAKTTLIIEHDNNTGIIELNRPDTLNALNQQMTSDLIDSITEMTENTKIRTIIITGSEKAFASGADITEMVEKTFQDMYVDNNFEKLGVVFKNCRKPIIAAVSGYALGAGCELAMMCDFIIAADNAKFGQPETNIGIISGMGGSQRLTRAVGKSKAMDMHLTGRSIDAKEAERMGLVSRIVSSDELIEHAREVAEKIADKPKLAVMAAKEAINHSFEQPLNEGLIFERNLFTSLFATEDKKEGMEAFLEKREPRFKGR